MKAGTEVHARQWHSWGALLLAILGLALAGGSAIAGPAATGGKAPSATGTDAASATDCVGGWEIVSSANVGNIENQFQAVSAVSPNDVWAVGYHFSFSARPNGGDHFHPLIQPWNGERWNLVPVPDIGTRGIGIELTAVDAVSATDAWA